MTIILLIAGIVIGIVLAAIAISMYAKNWLVILALVTPVVLALFLSSMTTVGTGEIAVMTRFGKVTGQELGEGFHFKNPFDSSNKYDVKVQRLEAQASAASKDLQDVNTTLVVNYELERGKVSEIHKTVGKQYEHKLIDGAIQEVFKASTAKFDATQLIQDRNSVKTDAIGLLRERLAPYGIRVSELSITNFAFSPDFAQAIEATQVAQKNAERAKFNLEASRTDAEAQSVQGATLTELYLQKQAIEKWNGVLPSYLGSGTVFNIPLNK